MARELTQRQFQDLTRASGTPTQSPGDLFDVGGQEFQLIRGATGAEDVFREVEKSSPIIMSTAQGAKSALQDQQKLDRLSPPVIDVPEEEGVAVPDGQRAPAGDARTPPVAREGVEQEEGFVTFVNPDTSQTQRLSTSAITPELVQSFRGQGFEVAESEGNVPSFVFQTNPAAQELAQAEIELEGLRSRINDFAVSDAELLNTVNNINQQFDTRIKEMRQINERRQASIETLGVRIGSRFTGGAGGVFGGIVAEEERQGIDRIAEIESQKQAAITAARNAAASQNWEVFGVQVAQAERRQEEKLAEVEKFNKILVENNAKVREQLFRAEGSIADALTR